MDISSLQSFLTLAEHGSFTRAANIEHLSQPAFSRRIRSLEQWLGAEVVDRSTFPASLTPVGIKLREQAGEMITSLGALREETQGRHTIPRQTVRIATSETLATGYFPGWWQNLGKNWNRVPLTLLPTNTLDAYEALLRGDCDLLLAYADPLHLLTTSRNEVEFLVLDRDRFSPYSAVLRGTPQYDLPGSSNQRIPLVSHSPNAFFTRITNRILAAKHPHIDPVAQADLTSALVEMVAVGLGVSWLPQCITAAAVQDGRIRAIGGHDEGWSTLLEIRLYRSPRRAGNEYATDVWRRAQDLSAGL